MTDMRIEREVVIDAPIEVVWQTVSEAGQITRWFAQRAGFESTPGAPGLLEFLNDEGEVTHAAPIVVESVEPPTLFSYRWCHPEGSQPAVGNSTLVEFILVSEGQDRTRLRVVESGLDLIDWPEDDKVSFVEEHSNGWNTMSDRLVGLFAGNAGG